jgi:hypothetical protein
MAPISRLGIHHFWNVLKKSSEWKSLADLALVLMTTPPAEVDNQCVFSLKCDIIGIHATRTSTELLDARARLKVQTDLKRHNSVSQEQISFVIIAFMFMRRSISKESQ